MLIGDDLSDFIPCVRATPAAPCTEAATADSRRRKVEQFSGYWGHGWYILPNPMHGSWLSFRSHEIGAEKAYSQGRRRLITP